MEYNIPSFSFSSARLRLLFRLALREWRGGFAGFRVFLACLALGVMAIAGITSISKALTEGLAGEGRRILGGDIAVTLVHREASQQEHDFLKTQGSVTKIATLRGMVVAQNGDSALAEVKSVEDAYPTISELVLDPAMTPKEAFMPQDGVFGAVADPILLARLGLKVGDTVRLGTATLHLRAVIISEPDKIATGTGLGPRLMIREDALRTSDLLQPGSLVRWTYRLILKEKTVAAVLAEAEGRLPEAGWDIRSSDNADPRFSGNIQRFTQFLTLVALTSLLVGGVGVASAAKGFVDRKRTSIAILKSLGASGGFIVSLYLMLSLMVAFVGIALGLLAGAALPFGLVLVFGHLLPLPVQPVVAPFELMVAACYGLLTALAFSLAPLSRAQDVPATHLFRDLVAPIQAWPHPVYLAGTGLALILLLLLAIFSSHDPRIALWFILGAGGAFVLLRLVGLGIVHGARKLPRPRRPALRLALGNLHRPGALTPSLIVSLGLGMTLLTVLALIDSNLRRQLTESLPAKAPSFFFLDIPSSRMGTFSEFLKTTVPQANIDQVPMMRGRIVALNSLAAKDITAREDVAWVLDGDRGITFSDRVPQGSRLIEGEWWPPSYTGPPLVSFDAKIAQGLGLKRGDTITVSVLGRRIDAKIANLRQIEWRNLGINFVMVFSPNTFAGAPHTLLATLTTPQMLDTVQEAALMRESARNFPFITAVRVREALEQAGTLVSQIVGAIRGASSIALIASLLVLAGALSASRQARLYDTVLLKTLGASRARILAIYALEYCLLGLAAAVFGLLAGTLAAWGIVTFLMSLDFVFSFTGPFLAATLAVGLTLMTALLGTAHLLSQKPAPWLRSLG
jgi:putative ABC transport system permease protein